MDSLHTHEGILQRMHPGTPLVQLLGPLQVSVDGQLREIKGRKQRILLAKLALADGRPVLIDTLGASLWDEGLPKNVGRSLQVHVSRLRSTINLNIELVNNVAYRLPKSSFSTDAHRFLNLHERGRDELANGAPEAAANTLDQALRLWRGPALADLSDSNILRAATVGLDEARNQAVYDWVEASLASNHPEGVISELRSSLDVDPLQEHRWRQLILALHRCGRHGEAMEAYQQARTVFIEELGIDPARVLKEVHAELQSAEGAAPLKTTLDISPRTPLSESPIDAPAGGTQLIGRSAELHALLELWRSSSQGLKVATITGEPGVGKSRLAAEVTTRVAAAGGAVLSGRCDPTIFWPYQPFAEMLRSVIEAEHRHISELRENSRLQRHLPGLAQVVPEHADPLLQGTHRTDPPAEMGSGNGAAEAVLAWLSVRSEKSPLLLFIDDVQWADAETQQLLRHMLSRPRPVNALIVATLRDRELGATAPDSSTSSSLLTQLLRQSQHIRHIPLRRFDDAETTQLLAAETPEYTLLSAETITFVRKASGGNPLFVVELARQLQDSGARLSGTEVPMGVRQVIDQRVSALSETTQELLRRASVHGAVFNVVLLGEMAVAEGFGAGDVDAMVDAAAYAQLIEPGAARNLYTFSHDVVRTTLYESLSAIQRTQLHGQLAELLEQRQPRRDPAAYHFATGGHLRKSDLPENSGRAAAQLLLAGQDALSRGASQNAERMLLAARDLIDETTRSTGLHCDILTELGKAQLKLGVPDYRDTLVEASRMARDLDDNERMIVAVLANNRGWWSSAHELDYERIAGIETALEVCASEDISVRARLLGLWAVENVRDPGCRTEVLERSAESLRLAEATGEEVILAPCLSARYTVLYALFEQPAECLQLSERLLSLANRQGSRMTRMSASVMLAQASMRFADYLTADRYTRQALQLTRTLEQPAREWLVATWEASRTGMRGRFEEAEQLVRKSLELGNRTEQKDAFTCFVGQMFTLRLQEGTLPAMIAEVGDQVAAVVDAIPAWRAAMAVVLADAGDMQTARSILEDFASDTFARLPKDILWLQGMCYLSIVCQRLRHQEAASGLYEALVPYTGMVATNGTIDAGPVDLHLAALASVSGQTELAEQHLADAMTLCRRIGADAWSAYAERYFH